MARSRQVRPETDTLPLSDGDWLLVKKRLNAGEQRKQFSRMYRDTTVGRVLDPVQMSVALILAYLLDWSLVDDKGNRIPIADKSEDDVIAALDSIDFESYQEIRNAIEAHEEAMQAERDAQKKIQSGERGSSPSTPSLVGVAGGWNG